MSLSLKSLDTKAPALRFVLWDTNKTYTLGRFQESDLLISTTSSSQSISRNHAKIRPLDKSKFEVTDLSSLGTFINGKRLPKKVASTLIKGDVLRLGNETSFKLEPMPKKLVFACAGLSGEEEARVKDNHVGAKVLKTVTAKTTHLIVPSGEDWEPGQLVYDALLSDECEVVSMEWFDLVEHYTWKFEEDFAPHTPPVIAELVGDAKAEQVIIESL